MTEVTSDNNSGAAKGPCLLNLFREHTVGVQQPFGQQTPISR